MNIIVIYRSKTGFTKQYAEWIAETLDCELAEYAKTRTLDLSTYDLIIYGGGVHAGMIDHLDAMKKRLGTALHKLIVFATGATPHEAKEEIEKIMHSNFGDSSIPHFYMQSGLCYEKMGLMDKAIMKAMSKLLSAKQNQSDAEHGTVNAIRASYDISDRKFIQPLIEYVKRIQ